MENISAEQLKQLQTEGKKILVDYWATWCGPCRQLIPRLESLESQHPDAVFVKIDVDQNQDHAMQVGIRGVPTVMIYNGEILVDRTSGIQPNNHYSDKLNSI